ncbi:hypothetical protein M422DRAFT_254851 [Sphaerobolus stellatus SS14]|uniref:Ndc10 domain-containing protein n=1 Tax=Sphaerobolus stellatus (strain SS14) TaxID=990650 RepID=A0A0C9UGH2_SPHS4|nr:hypothetical protein M422DRAFT_254851 [Sphaerobolus stellatus SS14]
MHFFVQFYVAPIDLKDMNFVPDFSDEVKAAGYGIWGRQSWYENKIFHTTDVKKTMGYDNHLRHVKAVHVALDISVSKATHATRAYAAEVTRHHGASVDDTKALGGWNDGGAFKKCYYKQIPFLALLAAATFNAHYPEGHHLPREHLKPPSEVLAQIFTWIEQEEAILQV